MLITEVPATPIYSIRSLQRAHSTFWCPSWLTGDRDFLCHGRMLDFIGEGSPDGLLLEADHSGPLR